MRTAIHPLLAACAVALCMAIALPASAAKPKAAQKEKQKIANDQVAVTAAQSTSDAAEKAYESGVAKAHTDFEQSDDYKSAQKTVVDATVALGAAREAAIATLKNDTSYAVLDAQETAAQQRIDKLKSQNAPASDIADASQDFMSIDAKFTAKQSAALKASPSYQSAKQTLADATAALKNLKDKFDGSLNSDPTISKLAKERDDAKAKLDKARAKLEADTDAAAK